MQIYEFVESRLPTSKPTLFHKTDSILLNMAFYGFRKMRDARLGFCSLSHEQANVNTFRDTSSGRYMISKTSETRRNEEWDLLKTNLSKYRENDILEKIIALKEVNKRSVSRTNALLNEIENSRRDSEAQTSESSSEEQGGNQAKCIWRAPDGSAFGGKIGPKRCWHLELVSVCRKLETALRLADFWLKNKNKEKRMKSFKNMP